MLYSGVVSPDEIDHWELEQEMRCRLGPSYNVRKYPRVRGQNHAPVYRFNYRVLDTKRTRRAAMRRGRELRAKRRKNKPTILVYPLPRKPRRKTVDWAVSVRVA